MSKRPAGPRTLICQRTGRKFDYAGVGRPPKYHPDVRKDVRREQRSASRKRNSDLRKAA